jgi:conjugal transfer pilus assembly protein TraF
MVRLEVKKLIIINILILTAFDAFGTPLSESWYGKHGEGWFWYKEEQRKSGVEKEINHLENNISSQKSKTYYTEQVDAIGTKNKEIFSRLIMEPSEDNFRDYVEVMKEVRGKISTLRSLQKTLFLKNPQFDPKVRYPISQDAIAARNLEEKKKITEKLTKMNKRYGLMLFVRNGCPYCDIFEPVVKRLEEKYAFKVLAVSSGGVKEDSLFKLMPDNGIGRQVGASSFPSLYLFEYGREKYYPVAGGAISLEEIERNIYEAVN